MTGNSRSAWYRLSRLLACVVLSLLAFMPHDGDAEEIRELLLGIEPEHNIFDQTERYRALADYLSENLGIKINLTIMSRYGEVLKRFKSRRLDGAFLSSYTVTLAINELNLTPVASPVNLDGVSTSQGYIFVRRDSDIKTVADMNGKSFVFVDPASTEGYVFPLSFLRENGIEEREAFWGRYYFSGSHASTVFAVLDGRADIGAAKDTVYKKQVAKDSSIGEELQVLVKSQPLPEVTLCIRDDLGPGVKNKLQKALVDMDKSSQGKMVLAEFEALRFIESQNSDFDSVLKMAREAEVSFSETGDSR